MKISDFIYRHIGSSKDEINLMLANLGLETLDQLISEVMPKQLAINNIDIEEEGWDELKFQQWITDIANKNIVNRSYIGQGFYNSITPAVINRNIIENPGWYTQYTPYQPEISQGRLELLMAFQTMIIDLTGMEIANASLLDEASAAAEAMLMAYRIINKRAKLLRNTFFVDRDCFPSTIKVLNTYARHINIKIKIGSYKDIKPNNDYFAGLIQTPNCEGELIECTEFCSKFKDINGLTIVGTDLGALSIFSEPKKADIVYGNSQRFGIPLYYGGPHAAFFASKKKYIREIPGRIVGISKDIKNKIGYRLTLQTREQHIKRDIATSNICTSQVLPAITATLYAIYHGSTNIKNIFINIHNKTNWLANQFLSAGYKVKHKHFFDTITLIIKDKSQLKSIKDISNSKKINLLYTDKNTVQISIDETVNNNDLLDILYIFKINNSSIPVEWNDIKTEKLNYRKSKILQNKIFNSYQNETEFLRYIKSLEKKDLSLIHAMIPLGSCTMKLNSTTAMQTLSLNGIKNIHPYAPKDQTLGYSKIIKELSINLLKITGYHAITFQPRSGAQGEYVGLCAIKDYFNSTNQSSRSITLIPSSAHGTNPASAKMCGYEVQIIKCDSDGNIDISDLKEKTELFRNKIACLMITYPSTHGIFEPDITEIIDILHNIGAQVYMDGANMNAQIGLTSPAKIGADVCHLNLHKTFSIPHGGGGPGVGPVLVAKHLAPFIPAITDSNYNDNNLYNNVSSTEFGNAGVLAISLGYIKMLGGIGLKLCSQVAILNANYLLNRLKKYFNILYLNNNNRVAHEFILDFRKYKDIANIHVIDISKRLIDFGFHPPTMSFPVAGTLMIEPTESESKKELDRFIEAIKSIYEELQSIINNQKIKEDNPIINAPHTIDDLISESWNHSYSRKQAVFPNGVDIKYKFWPAINRIDDVFGDRNIQCCLFN